MKKDVHRPSWDHFWFVQALMYSTRGTCDRLKTACVIVKDNRLVGAGYNGSPSGTPHCEDVGHLIIDGHCERTLHAEENAILNSERKNLKGAFAYMIGSPCIRCAKLLVNAGVKQINFLQEYPNSRGKEYIEELSAQSGVKFVHFDLDPQELIRQSLERLKERGGALANKHRVKK